MTATTIVKARDTHDVTWTLNADLTSVVSVEAHVRLVTSATPTTLAATVTNAAAGEITHTLTGTLASRQVLRGVRAHRDGREDQHRAHRRVLHAHRRSRHRLGRGCAMDRHLWTEADERLTWRRWVGWKHDLDDAEVLAFHLRDATRDPHWRPAPLPPRPRARHVAPRADDEEPSPVRSVTVYVIPKSTHRLRRWVVVALVAGSIYVLVTAFAR